VGQATVTKWATEPFREQLKKLVESAMRLRATGAQVVPLCFRIVMRLLTAEQAFKA
jgi:hypothetical protein